MRLGFIGLGNMGRGMAANILAYAKENSYSLTVYDINADAMTPFVSDGAIPATSAADIARQSEIIFTSLPSSKQVNAIALGADGLLTHLPKGATWFETSTSDVGEWTKVKDAAPDHLTLIDAPVTGGTEGAAAGTLTMLLGLDSPLSNEHKSLLESFTKKAVVMGPSGAGYIGKLCQLHLNYLVAQGIGEALMLGAKGNLDLTTLHDVLSHSCAQSYVVDSYIPKVLDGSYDDSFALGLAKKDMHLIGQLGEHLNVDMPLGDLVLNSYETALETYGFDAPHLSIVKLIEDKSEKKLRP